MNYLASLAHKFYQLVKQAGQDPKCRGCLNTNPWVNADKLDNTYFCRECKEGGHKDPSSPESIEPEAVPAEVMTDPLSHNECRNIILQGLTDYCAAFPQVPRAPFSFYANYIWQGYAMNGGTRGKDQDRVRQEEQQVETMLRAYMDTSPHIWTKVRGMHGGYEFDQTMFKSMP